LPEDSHHRPGGFGWDYQCAKHKAGAIIEDREDPNFEFISINKPYRKISFGVGVPDVVGPAGLKTAAQLPFTTGSHSQFAISRVLPQSPIERRSGRQLFQIEMIFKPVGQNKERSFRFFFQ
jgi:hypothetical protein